MIQLYTGKGKGKTTAAVGLAVRAAGRGLRVVFAQFMKGRETGEIAVLERLPQVKVLRLPRHYGFYSKLTDADKEELKAAQDAILEEILKLLRTHMCDLVVLDEVTYPVKWGLCDEGLLRAVLNEAGGAGAPDAPAPCFPEIVLTGRDAAQSLVDVADYVTVMQAVRHPFEKGVRARRGIEY